MTSIAGKHKVALRVSSVLWVVWGLVHVLAGVMTMASEPATAIGNIADAVDKASLAGQYPDALDGILSQHGWNLAWIGLTTLVGAVFIWRTNRTAIWVTALVGGMADVGYFVFIDLPGYAKFMPGTVMTIFSASAILLSFWAWWSSRLQQSE